MNRLRILQGDSLIPVGETEWSQWFWLLENRQVGKTSLGEGRYVSTICLGIDRGEPGAPAWFETLVCGVPDGTGQQYRWERHSSTVAEARAVHAATVRIAEAQLQRKRTPRA